VIRQSSGKPNQARTRVAYRHGKSLECATLSIMFFPAKSYLESRVFFVEFIGFVFVAGKASLLSQTFNRDLLVSIESEGGASQFIKLKLRAKPTKEDEEWSDWMTARERADLSPVPEGERIAVRYRVQPEE